MLSRIAENLYWLGRYLERAENTARLLDVNYLALVEAPLVEGAPDIITEQWSPLLDALESREGFKKHFNKADAQTVPEWLALHEANPSSIRSSLRAARENARALRDRISTEMWEAINRSYLELCVGDISLEEDALHDYCVTTRETNHLFFGIAQATLPHDLGWYFLRAGQYLERADNSLRTFKVSFQTPKRNTPVSKGIANWRNMALLKSLSAYEAFRKRYNMGLEPDLIAEFLLLDRSFPRSVLYSLKALNQLIKNITQDNPEASAESKRLSGALTAKLEFLKDASPVTHEQTPSIAELLTNLAELSNSLTDAYFSQQHKAAWQFQQQE